MDLRRRSTIRIDRLRSRLQGRFPAYLRHRLTRELEPALTRPVRKLEFMRFMDRFQRRLYEHLLRAYEDEPFCQLLALKLANLAVGKYHFINRHSVLMSKPFQLTVDPTNACQLGCPGCVHSSNRIYAAQFDWPRVSLPVSVYDTFLKQMGAFGFCVTLYNYGEPLLHKHFADFVRSSKKYLLFTMTSTNLSMPLDDTDDLVASGLDRMVLSIDGTTEEVYGRYRRKGRLGLVFENVRKLAASKKKLGSPTPYLIWQFLTFEHNAHQVDDAIRKARELGVNEILIQTPFGVEADDPGIRPVAVRNRGTHTLVRWSGNWCVSENRKLVAGMAPHIESLFNDSWERRFHEASGSDEENRPEAPTCDWLYQNITLDGAARLMPCCMAPDKNEKQLVFADFGNSDTVNSPMATLARLAFSDPESYRDRAKALPPELRPFCAECTENPLPYGLANVAGDIRALDEKVALPGSLKWMLTNWK